MTHPAPTPNVKSAGPRHFDYIDAVRGLAFLGVLLTHVSSVGGQFPGEWMWRCGFYGVQLFFLASAITLCYSMESRKSKDSSPTLFFYLRRFFRIAPMYWLAIVLYWSIPFEPIRSDWLRPCAPVGGPGLQDFILNALFLNGWNFSAFNSVVPGGWSIGVEMTFYAVFPLCFYFINSLSRATWALMAGFVYTMAYVHIIAHHLPGMLPTNLVRLPAWFFVQFCFPAQFIVFLIGIFTYHLLRTREVQAMRESRLASAFVLLASLALEASFMHGASGFIPAYVGIVSGFAGIIVGLSGQNLPGLINPVICNLGKISFSCYLVHFAVLSLVFQYFGLSHFVWAYPENNLSGMQNLLLALKVTAIALMGTAAISTATYHLVEKPGMSLGKHLIDRLNRRSSTLTEVGAVQTDA